MASLDALSWGLPEGYNMRDMEALSLVHNQPRCSADWLQGRIDLSQSGTVRSSTGCRPSASCNASGPADGPSS
jgi:hypothetical protein